jgi:hypothetical protein
MPADTPSRGSTVWDLAQRWRVSPDKVRWWIKSGALSALNTAGPGGKPRYVVLPEAVERFEAGRSAAPTPKPARRKKRTTEVDYFPG